MIDDPRTAALARALDALPRLAVAVSGGVDSVTLWAFAHAQRPGDIVGVHAHSAAVPGDAGARLAVLAAARGMKLLVLDAGEVADERYRQNPLDRCYVCKSHLYDAIRAVHDGPIASGTNRDDLSDFRPGLLAAGERGVQHPFVEAGFDKEAVRALARALDLPDIAELPAQPCLSSRVETGTRITPALLELIHAVESVVRAAVGPQATVRCRVRGAAPVGSLTAELELDDAARVAVTNDAALLARVTATLARAGLPPPRLSRYRRGSAFLHVVND